MPRTGTAFQTSSSTWIAADAADTGPGFLSNKKRSAFSEKKPWLRHESATLIAEFVVCCAVALRLAVTRPSRGNRLDPPSKTSNFPEKPS